MNFLCTLQGEAAGAQALSNFDTLPAPFVRYDKMDYEDVKQAIQGFVFSMNVATRFGSQAPFTNVTLDQSPSTTLKNQRFIIVGIEQKETYSEFQIEMDMINRAFAEVMMEGDAKSRVFSFPIPTYNTISDEARSMSAAFGARPGGARGASGADTSDDNAAPYRYPLVLEQWSFEEASTRCCTSFSLTHKRHFSILLTRKSELSSNKSNKDRAT